MHPILARFFGKKHPTLVGPAPVPGTVGSPVGETNPYLNARRTWNEHVGDVLAAKHTWQIIGLFSLCIALAAVGGVIAIGKQSKYIPFVVETDKLGQFRSAGPLHATTAADPRLIKTIVHKFIHQARVVTPDTAMQKKAVFDVYDHLHPTDPAQSKMSQHLAEGGGSNPFERSANEMVDIDIKTILQQTQNTWQVEWFENVRDRKGILTSPPVPMRALVTTKVVPPTNNTTERQMENNPFGIFIADYSWSRIN